MLQEACTASATVAAGATGAPNTTRRPRARSTHTTRTGEPKMVKTCTYPLTGDRPIDLVVTEAATFEVRHGGLTLVEIAGHATPDWIAEHTAAPYATALDARAS